MIRKIQDYDAWVCYFKDIKILRFYLNNYSFIFLYRLPLFDINPIPLAFPSENLDPDDLILVYLLEIKGRYERPLFTENFVDEVNKRWNEFYEKDTRK